MHPDPLRLHLEKERKLISEEGRLSNPRITMDPSDPELKQINQGLAKADPADLKQIFIKTVEGKHHCIQIKEGMGVREL